VTDTRQIRSPAEARMTQEGQQNAGGQRRTHDNGKPYYDQAPLSEYPRMMYRATEVEQTQDYADAINGLKDEPMVINRFGGLLCETMIAHDACEAEVLSTNGWDISAQAAHGVVSGLAVVTTAKDDEIAALRAQIEQLTAPPIKTGRDKGDKEPVA
jgi:hypothetical protein